MSLEPSHSHSQNLHASGNAVQPILEEDGLKHQLKQQHQKSWPLTHRGEDEQMTCESKSACHGYG